MKEINDQLYGYSYELDTTSESDGTKCFAVDTGTVFVAYKGVWYEQPGSFWAASISEGEDDLYKTSWEISKIVPASDLLIINAVDTGKRYVSFNGKWYEQPVQWSAPAAGGGGGGSELPAVTSDDNGDVLTVVEGAWGKAAPSGGGPLVVNVDYEYHETYETYTCDKTFAEIYAAGSAGSAVFVYKIFESDCMDYVLSMYTNGQNDNFIFVGTFRDDGNGYLVFKTLQYDAMTENDYPVCTHTFDSGGPTTAGETGSDTDL